MNPALLVTLIEKNGADLEAIEAAVGFPTLLKLLPHIVAILNTIQQQGKTS